MTWLGWESLGGVLTSGPAASSWSSGRLDVFVRGTDSALWHKWFQNGWSGWESLGGVLTSSPAAVSSGNGRIDVFVRGTDCALWHKRFQNGWSSWSSLGGVLTSEPAVASWGSGRLDVFVRGTDSALWHRRFQNGWSSWQSLGGVLTTGPAAVSWGSGRIDVFAGGTDSALWHKRFQNGWSGWSSLGGVITSTPAASSWAPGRLDVFAAGTDSRMWHKWFQNGWSGWESLGGVLTSAPAAVSWGPNRIDTFVMGTDSALWHKWWALVPTVRLHAKVLTAPNVAVNTVIQRMREVYASAGIAVQHASTENLNFPALNDLDVGTCTRGNTTAEQNQLFANRNNAGANDVVVYFVRSTVPPFNGCAAHPAGRPGAVVAQGATQWTLAHEVGHVLGLNHVNNNDRLMTGNGTGNITNPPPDLVASEVGTMIASPFTINL
jgi:hypothetical protein